MTLNDKVTEIYDRILLKNISGGKSIENIVIYRFCGNENNEIFQLNLDTLSVQCGTLSEIATTDGYLLKNYAYTSSKRSGGLDTTTGGHFLIYSYKGSVTNAKIFGTVTPEEKILDAGDVLFSFSGGATYWYQYLIIKFVN